MSLAEEPDEDSEGHRPEADLRQLVRSYRRAAYLVRASLRGARMRSGCTLRCTPRARAGDAGSFKPGSQVDRLAAVTRPFMAPGSPLKLSSFWQTLLRSGSIDEQRVAQVEKAFEAADRTSIAIQFNGKQLTGRDVYFAYGEGSYFDADPQAKELLDALSVGPLVAMVPLVFHDVCAQHGRLALAMLDVINDYEHSHPMQAPTEEGQPQCIYCLTFDGDFGSEEHVIPESLGGDELVLRGSVCRRCNNNLASLDERLLDFEPIAMLRTMYVPLTKAGKFPRARFQDADFRKSRLDACVGTPSRVSDL